VNGERTVFGWDGDTLAYESGEQGSTHYLYEAGSFVPMVQYVSASVDGFETPSRRETDRYVPEDDPLQRLPERVGEAHAFYYHCDQIGTPQLLTDDEGDVVWEASYKAWGEAREVIARASKAAGIVPRNLLRFQGQQFDDETGLHYNRYRYYDPNSGRFVSKDPIGLVGGINVFHYAPNPIVWIDPLGLQKKPSVPPHISRQKQAGHVLGEPQYDNRVKQGKPTSCFCDWDDAVQYTDEAWSKGSPVPGRPNVRDHDFKTPIGFGPNGGTQTSVRVHQDNGGKIHGHPKGPESP
jgi:RHS repeat-associated protein